MGRIEAKSLWGRWVFWVRAHIHMDTITTSSAAARTGKSLNFPNLRARMQTVNVSFFRPTWIMIYLSTRSPTHRAINPAWQSLIPATVYNVQESSSAFCFWAFSKELLMNKLHFFTLQNYHIAIIHLHVVFKCIESSEKLGGTTNVFNNNTEKGGGGCYRLQNGGFCFTNSTRKQQSWKEKVKN